MKLEIRTFVSLQPLGKLAIEHKLSPGDDIG